MGHIYCNIDLGDHEQIECQDFPMGGSDQLLLLEPDHTITDFSNASQLLAAIAADEATLVQGISAEIPEGTPVNIDNPVACGSDQIAIDTDRTILFTDSNVTPDNVTFYNNLNKKVMGVVVYECAEDRITVIDHDVDWSVKRVLPKKKGDVQQFVGVGSWRFEDDPPIIEPAPAGVFV